MPWYQALGGGGGSLSGGRTTGWTTTSSTTASSYLNPFYGATGGTGTTASTTDDWNCATYSSVMWISTTNGSPENQLQLAQWHVEEQQRLMSAYQQENIRAQEYNRRIMSQEDVAQANAQAAAYRADEARQRAEREAAHEASRQRAVEFIEKQKLARERAKELLLSKLSPEQRKTFADNNWFVVEGNRTKTKYRIRGNTYAGNIDVLDVANKVTYRLCVHCVPDVPLEDHLLSQKLMLELAEDSIVRLANRHAAYA